MNMQTVNTKKLKVKDIITVALLSLINVVIFFAGSFLYATPVTILLMPRSVLSCRRHHFLYDRC